VLHLVAHGHGTEELAITKDRDSQKLKDRAAADSAGSTETTNLSAETPQRETEPAMEKTMVQIPPSPLAQMDTAAFARFLDRLAKYQPLLTFIALSRREGLSPDQIVLEHPTLNVDDVQLMIYCLENFAKKEYRL
jgi:hypothetical protein